MRRTLFAGALTATVLPLLSGCTVPSVGQAAVGVDADGNPVGYLQVCQEHIDGATLYVSDTSEVRGSWSVSPAVTDFSSWSLTAPTGNWSTRNPLSTLHPETEYVLYGWTTDNSSSASHMSFTLKQLASLRPGQVMYGSADHQVVSDEATFRADTCRGATSS